MIPPIALRYEGDGQFVASHAIVADNHFVCGARYVMAQHEMRSMKSHAHEFAWLAEAWTQLPEHLVPQFPSPEHLRKRALIETGFYLQSHVECGSNAAAIRVATFVQADDLYAVAVVERSTVIKRVAESQSVRAMGNKRFQESKQKILEWVSALIDVKPDILVANAARAA